MNLIMTFWLNVFLSSEYLLTRWGILQLLSTWQRSPANHMPMKTDYYVWLMCIIDNYGQIIEHSGLFGTASWQWTCADTTKGVKRPSSCRGRRAFCCCCCIHPPPHKKKRCMLKVHLTLLFTSKHPDVVNMWMFYKVVNNRSCLDCHSLRNN